MSNSEPTVITLDSENSVQFLVQFVEVAQQKGAFTLNEADLLKRATDVVINNVKDNEINDKMAKSLLIQAVHKGQRHGSYTLQDASVLNKIVNYVTLELETSNLADKLEPNKFSNNNVVLNQNSVTPTEQKPVPQNPIRTSQNQSTVQKNVAPSLPKREEKEDDLSDLAEPIPLRPNII